MTVVQKYSYFAYCTYEVHRSTSNVLEGPGNFVLTLCCHRDVRGVEFMNGSVVRVFMFLLYINTSIYFDGALRKAIYAPYKEEIIKRIITIRKC